MVDEIPDGFKLIEFVAALKQAYELAIPTVLLQQESSLAQIVSSSQQSGVIQGSTFDPKKNLFEHFSGMDLTCLIGHAYIIPYNLQRAHEKSGTSEEDLIKSLHPLFSTEFNGCFENIESRLERMFLIKDKWTLPELSSFLCEFLEPEMKSKFDIWLTKNTRSHKVKNPYVETNDVFTVFYSKMF